MDSLLIVSSTMQATEFLIQFLQGSMFQTIKTAKNSGEARRLLIEQEFDLIIIYSPLKDEYGDDLAIMIVENTTAAVILIVKGEMSDEISEKVEDFGVFVLARPLGKQLFYQAIKFVGTSRKRIFGLKNENDKLYKKIEDIRLIDRAKCVLIQYLHITEPQAHRYIEKQAMDMRISKKEVAQGILKTYES